MKKINENFQEIKKDVQQLINECEQVPIQVKRVYNSTNIQELSVTIKENFEWLCKSTKNFSELLEKHKETFAIEKIYVNESAVEGFILAYDDANIIACDSAIVIAYDNSFVECYDKSKVVAYGNSYVRLYDKAKVKAYDNVYVLDLTNPRKQYTKRWRADNEEKYYYIDALLNICSSVELGRSIDNDLYNKGNYFRTENQAQKYVDRMNKYFR